MYTPASSLAAPPAYPAAVSHSATTNGAAPPPPPPADDGALDDLNDLEGLDDLEIMADTALARKSRSPVRNAASPRPISPGTSGLLIDAGASELERQSKELTHQLTEMDSRMKHLEELSGMTGSEAAEQFAELKAQLAAHEDEMLTIKHTMMDPKKIKEEKKAAKKVRYEPSLVFRSKSRQGTRSLFRGIHELYGLHAHVCFVCSVSVGSSHTHALLPL